MSWNVVMNFVTFEYSRADWRAGAFAELRKARNFAAFRDGHGNFRNILWSVAAKLLESDGKFPISIYFCKVKRIKKHSDLSLEAF